MKFESSIIWSGKIYKFLEKFNYGHYFCLDEIIDSNYPQILSKLQTYCKEAKIVVCATNGKKTILNILNQIFKSTDKTFITNLSDKAKLYPILTSIVLELSENIEQKDFYTMALDEYELSSYFNSIKFNYLLLHNLFNDQRDFCSLEEKRKKIQDAIVLNSKLNLIINADEPMFFQIDNIKNDTFLTKKRNKFFYGFNEINFCDGNKKLVHKNDIIKCPNCGCTLDFDKNFYSHLGIYNCECGFKRPKLDLSANAEIFSDYILLEVFYKDNKFVFKLPFGGIYNAYNALGAIALAINLNVERKLITNAFENYQSLKGRDDFININNKIAKIKMVKNPISLTEVVRELYASKNIKAVFCLNDDKIDGLDPSWIWESNFGALEGFENKIYVCGNRFDDMALKLKYSGVNPCLINMDNSVQNSIKCCGYELENNEKMLIITVPSLLNEVYEALV